VPFNLSQLVARARTADLARDACGRETHPPLARVRVRDRFVARFQANRLDEMLASGVAPSTEPALAWRARILTGHATRDSLASEVRAVLRAAYAGNRHYAQVAPRRAAVIDAGAELEAIVHRLMSRGEVDPRGVAQVRLMLTDGSGPLHHRAATETLRAVSRRALSNLRSAPQPAA
jgi:hypothetical protein